MMGAAEREKVAKQASIEQQNAHAAWVEAESRVAAVTAAMEGNTFNAKDFARLAAVTQEISDLGYDDDARAEAFAQAQELAPCDRQVALLDTAEANLPRAMEEAQRQQEALKARTAELARLTAQHSQDAEAIKDLPLRRQELRSAMAEQETLLGLQTIAVAQKGYFTAQVDRLATLQTDQEATERRLAEANGDQAIYQALVTAFGRTGIQAMLIETVVPRIEEEANQILGRMTDGAMHIRLETLVERRSGKGDPSETLDIHVSDEQGSRPYEMFSGGEAFRINLSLRIALSRVLAQRTGAPMPVLFIDEGFGSQDTAGIERVMGAISTISAEFEKIIVITHLEDMKGTFPARIEVAKGPHGSTFSVS